MSGGTAVQTESHGRGAGAGAAEPRAMAFARSEGEGLGLDGGRGRRPSKRRKKSQPARAVSRCARDRSRMAETVGWLGLRERGPKDAALQLVVVLQSSGIDECEVSQARIFNEISPLDDFDYPTESTIEVLNTTTTI